MKLQLFLNSSLQQFDI